MTHGANPAVDFGFMLVAAVILFLGFLALREVWCWYWKINKALALLQEIAANTRRG